VETVRKILVRLGNLKLPTVAKILLWRLAGYQIGKDVVIANDVKIICGSVKLGDNITIEGGTRVIGLKKLEVGSFTEIGRNCEINGDSELSIGENCFVGMGTIINVRDLVKVGNNTALAGAYVQIWTHSTWMEEVDQYNIPNKIAPVLIGENCYIGAGSIILPGVKIGDNSVVGAGAVVTKGFPGSVLIAGVPAKKIKKIKKEGRNPREVKQIIEEFLREKKIANFSFYPNLSGKVVFSFGEEVEANNKSVFDLKNKTCRLRNKEGVKVKKLLNDFVARFKVIK